VPTNYSDVDRFSNVSASIPFYLIHGKNAFAEVSKNLARYKSENNFTRLSKYNNYVERLSVLMIMLQKVLTF